MKKKNLYFYISIHSKTIPRTPPRTNTPNVLIPLNPIPPPSTKEEATDDDVDEIAFTEVPDEPDAVVADCWSSVAPGFESEEEEEEDLDRPIALAIALAGPLEDAESEAEASALAL